MGGLFFVNRAYKVIVEIFCRAEATQIVKKYLHANTKVNHKRLWLILEKESVSRMVEVKEEKSKKIMRFADDYVARNLCAIYNGTLYVNVEGEGYIPKDENQLAIAVKQYFYAKGERILANMAKKVAEEILTLPLRQVRENEIPWNLVALKGNWLLDIFTFSVSYNPGIFLPFYLDVEYDPAVLASGCLTPVFDKILQQLSNRDMEISQRIWEMMGCVLSNDVYYKKFFVLQGVSGSGKSTIIDILMDLMPRRYVTSLSLDKFNGEFGMATLCGKALVVNTELANKEISDNNSAKLKEATGGDTLTSNVKYKEPVTFQNRSSIIFATNHTFRMETTDQGLLNRACVIPFTSSIPQHLQRDRMELMRMLQGERLAIVFKALHAFILLKNRQYQFAGNLQLMFTVRDAEGDASVEAFIYEMCTPYPNGQYGAVELYKFFEKYCWVKKRPCARYERFELLMRQEFEKGKGHFLGSKNPLAVFKGMIVKAVIR